MHVIDDVLSEAAAKTSFGEQTNRCPKETEYFIQSCRKLQVSFV